MLVVLFPYRKQNFYISFGFLQTFYTYNNKALSDKIRTEQTALLDIRNIIASK